MRMNLLLAQTAYVIRRAIDRVSPYKLTSLFLKAAHLGNAVVEC